MNDKSPTRTQLGAFLRARRAELTRDMVGLPPWPGQRRVRGPRREEVAERATVSTDYYTRLEQGRLASISESVLAAVCQALMLNPDQESYVRTLAHKPAAPSAADAMGVDAATRHLVNYVDVPVLVLGRYLDVVAWNPLSAALFLDFGRIPREHRNLVWLAFLDSNVRAMFADWTPAAQTCVAFLRMDAARFPDDPRLASLVGELSVRDHDFRTWWASQNVSHHNSFGRKRYRHPTVGELTLDWQIYQRPDNPDTSLAFLIPTPGSPSEEAVRTLARGDCSPR